MLKNNIKMELVEYFLLSVFTYKRMRSYMKLSVLLVSFLILFAGCEDSRQPPVVTTIYIDETNEKLSETDADQNNLKIESIESEQKVKTLDSKDINPETISSISEKVLETENKPEPKAKNDVSNIQLEQKLEKVA